MRHLILFLMMMFVGTPVHAAPADASAVVKAAVTYCLGPVKDRIDPADLALQKKLLEFSADQAVKFSPQGGRVFALPGLEGNAVLVVPQGLSHACGIAIRQVQAIGLWAQIEKYFGKDFRLIREKREETLETTRREYHADMNGSVVLLGSIADGPRAGAMQALITIARTQN